MLWSVVREINLSLPWVAVKQLGFVHLNRLSLIFHPQAISLAHMPHK